MSALFKKKCLSSTELQSIKEVKTGRIPRHIAFIMDGNRRFAKKLYMPSSYGHYKGSGKLTELIQWCLALGVPEITVYAFSIENFKRSKTEVNALMDLARYILSDLLEHIYLLTKPGIRLHIEGRLSLVPDDLRALACRAMLATRHERKLRVNMAFAYTGRDEMSRAASQLVYGVQKDLIKAQDIDEALMSRVMDLSEPELLIRTSGEVRLSDFMLWQVSNTMLYFTEVLWPEFSLDDLLAAIIHFQRFAPKVKQTEELCEHKLNFIEHLETERWSEIERISSNYENANQSVSRIILDKAALKYMTFYFRMSYDIVKYIGVKFTTKFHREILVMFVIIVSFVSYFYK